MSTIGKRFKESRTKLKLTRNEVGDALGISADMINNIERDRIQNIKLKEPLLKLYCQKYNINFVWLMEGIGNPLIDFPTSIIDSLAEQYGLDDDMKSIIKKFIKLSPTEKEVAKKLFLSGEKKEND